MRAKRLTAIIFVGVLGTLMCMVFAGVSMKAAKKLNAASDAVNIEWDKLYPFDENLGHALKPKVSKFAYIKDKTEKYSAERMAGGTKIIEAAKTYEELICWNMAAVNDYNPVIKLHDGYLSDLAASCDISENAEAVKELDSFCRDLGIEYVYINLPVKLCTFEEPELSGILDYSNQNADRLIDAISKAGVKCYDFREILHTEGMNHHKAFFVTDHHWKPETGLWASKHILQILRDDYGWNADPEILNPDRFEYKVYPECFLGSHGKKVTLARTQPDDFTMIYPKFATLIYFEAPAIKIDTSGDFSVTYNIEQAEDGKVSYGTYKYADLPLGRIHNLLNHDGKKILFIHDSMLNCVIPFTALGIEYTEEIDLRYFSGSIRSYIKTSKPDIVLTAYHSGVPGRTRAAKYPSNKFYDFR